MNKSKVHMIALSVSFLAIAGLGFVIAKNYTLYQKAKELSQKEHLNLQTMQAHVVELKEKLHSYETEKEEFSKMLYQEKDIPAFLDGIDRFAKESGVNIVDMKTQRFQQVIPKKISESNSTLANRQLSKSVEPEVDLNQALTLAAMPIDIRVNGSYANFVKFLSYLEDFKQLITISNVDIVAGPGYPMLQSSFTLKSYSLITLQELKYI